MTVVWYAAYGSNTDAERFRAYLTGCRDLVEPLASRPHVIDLPLYFAGTGSTTSRWGPGGVAFAHPDREAGAGTLARAWLLPVERLAEIGAQENRLPLTEARLDLDRGDHVAFPGAAYDTWAHCGVIDGDPVVTLTSSVERNPRSCPSQSYASTIARGLRHTHEMTRETVAEYLAPRTNLSVSTLIEWQMECRAEGHGYLGAND